MLILLYFITQTFSLALSQLLSLEIFNSNIAVFPGSKIFDIFNQRDSSLMKAILTTKKT